MVAEDEEVAQGGDATGASARIADLPARIRVLTLTDRFGPIGGAEHLAAQIPLRLDRERFEPILCASRWHPDGPADPGVDAAARELEAGGVALIGLGRRGRVDVRAWARLRSELRGRRVDVLHAHQFGSNVWGTVVGRLARTPVVVAHEHTWSYEGQPVRKALDRHLIGRFSDAFVAVSREDRRRMMEIEGIPESAIRYIPNGAPESAPAAGRDVRAELGIPADAPVVGSVGILRPQKAFEVLIAAADRLRAEHPAVRVLIAGYGQERERLEAEIARRGLGETVLLLGHRDDVPDLLRALDVAACSSDYEGMPLAVLEYMDAGLPVVSTAVGGVPDVVVDGETGLLVPRRDDAALAAALSALLGDRERARRLGEAGRVRRRSEFDLDTMVRRLEALYTELLRARR